MLAEYNGTNGIRRRYVHGPGVDEPLMSYEGSGTSVRRWYHADERGSIVAISDGTGAREAVSRYDEYGQPQAPPPERFGYTGQPWLPGANLWYYRARMYNPSLGRFMQTDPIGYGAGMNLYAYVGNDPVNSTDSSGTDGVCIVTNYGWYHGSTGEYLGPAGVEIEGCVWDLEASDGGDSGEGGDNGGSSEEDPECPQPNEDDFDTWQQAAVAGSSFSRAQEREADDNNERCYHGIALPNGRFAFSEPVVGTPGECTHNFPGNSAFEAHIHLDGGGIRLSRARDSADRWFAEPRDVERRQSMLDVIQERGGNPNNWRTVLGGDDGVVRAWRGRDLEGDGETIGTEERCSTGDSAGE